MEIGNIVILIAIILVVGFGLVFWLKTIILKQNLLLLESYEKNNNKLLQAFDVFFENFQGTIKKSYETDNQELKLFTAFLKKETDKYSEAVSKYKGTINSLNEQTIEFISSNKDFIKELRESTFKDLKQINENLKTTRDVFVKTESSFNKTNESTVELLKSISNIQQIFKDSEQNVSSIMNLNNNLDSLVKNFKEAVVQMELVSRSIAAVSETKLQKIVNDVGEMMPKIREDSSKLSSDLYGKFSDSLDVLDKLSNNLNSTSQRLNQILDGSKKDPVTGEFIN